MKGIGILQEQFIVYHLFPELIKTGSDGRSWYDSKEFERCYKKFLIQSLKVRG